ncbi:M16 family metallopeptidase [Dokdonella fugitiva]|jgi:predicted Zn-dependent peptidase|uniref:Putative Zn-dependent peptidase n=1 Tax=Dokdonella fugitiva TaxID=328517 RepID=A0A4R2IEQ3_9GAMM|nr:pitrilysin family protein [Dokdonella fugitiva]TCO43114.1 putative Zn-dependent peptidase [Dokdonella fugitiva]
MRKPLAFLAATVAFACGGVAAHAAGSDAIDIPFTRFTLPNGLTVVVSEDHKAPVVAVSVWYHVGSADEPAGKTGFAHLFEHLMFQGSENHKDEFFRPFELAGATDQNGTTWFDRTNYYETVPTTALDMTLWMESDRMGHLLGAIGQAELDEQRGVVQNEKRQGENQPYGRVDERVAANAFPANHPYHHDTIGSMKDLDAASLADVRQWFQAWYGAANVTVALVGDITPEVAKEKMLKYFGDIPAGPPVPRQQPWVAPRTESTRDTMTDRVAQTRIVREWNVPGLADADAVLLDLAADVLGGGKTSRLYERLVYKDKLVDDVSVSVQAFALASMLQLSADVKNGVDPAKVEAAIADEWKKFLEHGPTADELERVRTDNRAHFIRALEKVNSKASVLAEGQVYRDDPAAYKQDLARMDAATPASVLAAAKKWIARGDYTLTITPAAKDDTSEPADEMEKPGRPALAGRPEAKLPAEPAHAYTTTPSSIDRSKGVPAVATFPDLGFPKLERGKLRNGIDVVLAQRHAIPVVQVQMLFDAGYASDQGRKLGTSAFTMAMLDEGTAELDSLEIARRAERLGAIIGAGSGLDSSNASLNALASQLEPSLKLFADVVRNAAFRDADIARIRGQWLARIAQEKTQPTSLALRSLPPLIYGAGHAYAIPFTGSGTEASISSLDAADLRAWVRDFIRPDNVTILVAGDTTLDAVIAKLDAVFGDWKAADTPVPKKNIAHVDAPKQPRLFLLDKPGASQSLILAGVVAPSTKAKNNLEIRTMNGAFGGSFTSRLNMNLREAKHWAYGAGSLLSNAIGQRPFLMYAPVQTDKTAESVAEILREAKELVGTRPLTHEEIDKIKVGDVRSLPGEYQTTGSVLAAITSMKLYDRPDDYVQTLKARIEAQTDEAVQAAAREVVRPDALTWVVVGDLARIEASLRKLELGAVEVIDADGRKVR